MSEHKHTPKPWTFHPSTHINDHECAGNVSAIVDGEPLDVVAVWKADVDDLTPVPGATANGHLIAAAPNLLEALVVSREALSKVAEGLKAFNSPSAETIRQILGDVMAFSDAALAKAKPEAAQ